jgi:hypothetical protein
LSYSLLLPAFFALVFISCLKPLDPSEEALALPEASAGVLELSSIQNVSVWGSEHHSAGASLYIDDGDGGAIPAGSIRDGNLTLIDPVLPDSVLKKAGDVLPSALKISNPSARIFTVAEFYTDKGAIIFLDGNGFRGNVSFWYAADTVDITGSLNVYDDNADVFTYTYNLKLQTGWNRVIGEDTYGPYIKYFTGPDPKTGWSYGSS